MAFGPPRGAPRGGGMRGGARGGRGGFGDRGGRGGRGGFGGDRGDRGGRGTPCRWPPPRSCSPPLGVGWADLEQPGGRGGGVRSGRVARGGGRGGRGGACKAGQKGGSKVIVVRPSPPSPNPPLLMADGPHTLACANWASTLGAPSTPRRLRRPRRKGRRHCHAQHGTE